MRRPEDRHLDMGCGALEAATHDRPRPGARLQEDPAAGARDGLAYDVEAQPFPHDTRRRRGGEPRLEEELEELAQGHPGQRARRTQAELNGARANLVEPNAAAVVFDREL